MALTVDPIVTITHSSGKMVIVDATGDYNAVTNPTGWDPSGTFSTARSTLTDVTTIITPPGAAAINFGSIGANFLDNGIRAQDISSSLSLADGLWKFETTFVVGTEEETVLTYSFRDVALKCAIGKLALGDMTSNDFAEVKLLYDKLIQVMECGEYQLVEELHADIIDALSSCVIDVRKSCGC